MDAGDIAASVIAALSLVVSAYTAHQTFLAGFKGTVLPDRRAVLAQLDDTLSLILGCEFVNRGARAGSVEDLMLRITAPASDSPFELVPRLVREELNARRNGTRTSAESAD